MPASRDARAKGADGAQVAGDSNIAGTGDAADAVDVAAGVNLLVALRAEADPLIDHFGLRAISDTSPLQVWTNTDNHVRLVVAGSGRVAAAAAVVHLAANLRNNVWLNVGIGGHIDMSVSTAVVAHRIAGPGDRRWYPPLTFALPCRTASVTTVDQPCSEFANDDVHDMEAAGFYEIAARYSPHELVHCLKVISDNRTEPSSRLTPQRVSELITANLGAVTSMVEALRPISVALHRRRSAPSGFEDLAARYRFSVTQQHQLRKLLRRWDTVFAGEDAIAFALAGGAATGAAALALLADHLDGAPPAIGEAP